MLLLCRSSTADTAIGHRSRDAMLTTGTSLERAWTKSATASAIDFASWAGGVKTGARGTGALSANPVTASPTSVGITVELRGDRSASTTTAVIAIARLSTPI